MGHRPKSRREALLDELCVKQGYCSSGFTEDDLSYDLSAEEIIDKVLGAEGNNPTMIDGKDKEVLVRMVKDWMFDPGGRGMRSGLPR